MEGIDKDTKRKILKEASRIRNYLANKGVQRCKLRNVEAITIYASMRYNESIPEPTRGSCYRWLLGKINHGKFSSVIVGKTTKLKSDKPVKAKKVKITRKEEYAVFLRTSYWRTVRSAVIFRDQNKCTKCGDVNRLHVHHLTYENHNNEHEHTEDLITLCENCHNEIHRNTHKRAVKKVKFI